MAAQNAAAVLTTQIEAIEKKLPVMFDREDTVFSMFEKRPVTIVSNKSMRIPLELTPGGYFGQFDPDGGDLGRGSASVFSEATIGVQHFKHAVEITQKAEWGTDSSRKSIIDAFKHMLSKAMPDFRRHVEALCQTAGDGVLGTTSVVSASSGTDTVTLGTDGFGAKLLRKGQKVNVYDATLATHRTGAAEVEISYYDVANKIIKFPSVTGHIATDKIVISGVTGASPTSLLGIPYHHSIATTGTWLGYTRSTTPEIISNGVNAAGALALSHARLARNKIGDRLGMENVPKLIAFAHPCQQQAYEELGQLVSVIQKTKSDEGMNLYFGDSMQLAGSPLKTSYMWDKTRIDFLNLDMWGRAELAPIAFHTVEGRKIFEIRGPSGGVATSKVVYIVGAFNIFNMNPASGAFVYGLTVPTGY
jgi:hypothetical protein